MSIDLMKVFIRCPNCDHTTFLFDYHENESSERYEYFNVLNMITYPFLCSECKTENSYDYLFSNGYCDVENIDEYKVVFKRGLENYLNNEYFCFSEWHPERSEQPALDRLCKIYHGDSELQDIARDYRKVRIYGQEYLKSLKEKNENSKEENNMPIRFTGFSTPFGGASWEYTTSVEKRIKDLFILLESKRLLSNPWYLEVVEQCVESALEIRSAFVSVSKDVDFPDGDRFVLSSMIDASNKFLDDLNKIQELTPQIHMGDNLFDYALKQYRDIIRNGIRYFEASYSLKFNKEF